jgi:hypothetical protein
VIRNSTPSDDTKVTTIEASSDEEVTVVVPSLDNEIAAFGTALPMPLFPLPPAELAVVGGGSSFDNEVVITVLISLSAVVVPVDIIMPGFAAAVAMVPDSGT